MKKITILVPAYNEASNLPRLVEELDRATSASVSAPEAADPRAYEWEYLVVNDGSSDTTAEVLAGLRSRNHRVNYVCLSRNFGKENALLAGMDFAKGDAVIIMDADLQHPADSIPTMLYWWEQGYDDVYGMRSDRGSESWMRRRLSLAFYRMLQQTTRIEVLQNVGDFRLLDRRAIDAIRSMRETQRYTKGLYCWVGYAKKGFAYNTAERHSGSSSFSLRSLVNLAVEGITSYTTAPLRLASVLGFVVSLAALCYLIFVIFKTIVWGENVQGFPTLLCVMLFLGGVQLISLGIIGEYVGRIFNETKQRPPYLANTYNGQKI